MLGSPSSPRRACAALPACDPAPQARSRPLIASFRPFSWLPFTLPPTQCFCGCIWCAHEPTTSRNVDLPTSPCPRGRLVIVPCLGCHATGQIHEIFFEATLILEPQNSSYFDSSLLLRVSADRAVVLASPQDQILTLARLFFVCFSLRKNVTLGGF